MKVILSALCLALAWLFLLPDTLLAWGPGTHVAIGEAILRSLHLLPPAVAGLLESYPVHFLYGSVAADISFAKKYAPEGRHCHHWHVGQEIIHEADSDSLRATSLGYLCHLAADTVAHNFFIPRRLLLTSSTQSVGHTYWEHRVDVQVGEDFLTKARTLVMDHDHSEADELFDHVLSRTLFSFQTNRRIFRGMIRFQDNDRWRRVFDRMLQSSRWELDDVLVERYMALSFDYVADYLAGRTESRPFQLDPTGNVNLRLAKHIRRQALAEGGGEDPGLVREMADDFFPLPRDPLIYWPRADTPAIVSPASRSQAGDP